MNILGIFLFLVIIIFPYAAEQVAYYSFVGNQKAVESRKENKMIRGYDWAYVWDAAHFSVLVAAGFRFIGNRHPLSAWEWFGCFVFLAGIVMRIWALRELGVHYDTQISINTDREIVPSGPYRLVRHPLYFGTVSQILGMAILAPVWLGLPVAIIAFAFTLLFIHFEDDVLLQNIGENYKKYYEKTWDLADLVFGKPT